MPELFHPDKPIRRLDEDRLGRGGLAISIADHIRAAPVDEGFVIGLFGPWGSGKSSILNLTANELQKSSEVEVLWFNPWLFSGTQDLLTHFFSVIGSNLKLRTEKWAKDLGGLFDSYGGLLTALDFIPGITGLGSLASTAVRGTGGILSRRAHAAESLEKKRQAIREALQKAPKRLVFLIDDLDRLHNPEILELMRLVRLVGDFPHCIYVLAFDAKRVTEAVRGVGGDGNAYLEKIVQVVFEVPPVRRTDLHQILIQGIGQAEDAYPHGPFDSELWQNVYALGMFPLFRKVRDVRRYLNVLPITMRAIGEEVALTDVLACEAIRVLRPDIYVLLQEAVPALTTLNADHTRHKKDSQTKAVDGILDAAGSDRDAVRQLLTRLFPATQQYLENTGFPPEWLNQWSKERRVAHERVLRFYLERSYPEGTVTNAEVGRLFDQLGDEEQLRATLVGLSDGELEQALERIEDYEDDFQPDVVGPAVRAFTSQLPRLGDETRGFFAFSPETKLSRIVYRLLRSIKDDARRERLIQELYESMETLRAKRMLVLMSGHQQNAGHGFISKPAAEALEKRLASEIAAAQSSGLLAERQPLRTYYWVVKHGTPEELGRLRATLKDPAVFLHLLTDAVQQRKTQTVGDVAVKAEPILPWEVLKEILGADELNGMITEALPRDVDGLKEGEKTAVELARKYAAGWSPKD